MVDGPDGLHGRSAGVTALIREQGPAMNPLQAMVVVIVKAGTRLSPIVLGACVMVSFIQ